MRYLHFTLLILLLCSSCVKSPKSEDGVSIELAQYRKETISDLKYSLHFDIPSQKSEPISGTVTIYFNNSGRVLPQIDFKAPAEYIKAVSVDGKEASWKHEHEHITITNTHKVASSIHSRSSSSDSNLSSCSTTVCITFTAPDQSLNRRDDLLYTLLVPDRARTLFPCFDQPDLKARYTLSLSVPSGWSAVSNTTCECEESLSTHKNLTFRESEPLSTYLFSFVAGKFEKETASENGRDVSMYHRETDPKKLAQIPEIFKEVFESIGWLEDYTGIKYPFEKYDFIVLPGFQYGGMEHTGATLYNDTRIFLNEGAGIQEKMNRYSLIAHETAHMWFGDYVTMEWFDEVWTKEVFANYFAAMMLSWKFPKIDLGMNFVDYASAAYSEDRTAGSTPIKQPLDNLKNAGLVYGNIIYNKSPIVMEILATKLGSAAFRSGVRQYLNKFAYGNASWSDLISIFDSYCEEDLKQWSHVWVEEKGMPTIRTSFAEGNSSSSNYSSVEFSQEDPLGRGISWDQPIATQVVNGTILPNIDAKAYGYFVLENPAAVAAILLDSVQTWGSVKKASILINLNENYLNNNYLAEDFGVFLLNYLRKEQDPLLFSQAIGYLSRIQLYDRVSDFDTALWNLAVGKHPESCRRSAFSALVHGGTDSTTIQKLRKAFLKPETFTSFKLTESNLTTMAWELSIRLPKSYSQILSTQRARISNPDRLARFDFISKAVVCDDQSLDSLFQSLLEPENRRIEPWTATTLSYLNHPLRSERSRKYILPALEELQEIQVTGDIFFPKNWVTSLLHGHPGAEADTIISGFFRSHPDYPTMLGNKIKQTR